MCIYVCVYVFIHSHIRHVNSFSTNSSDAFIMCQGKEPHPVPTSWKDG